MINTQPAGIESMRDEELMALSLWIRQSISDQRDSTMSKMAQGIGGPDLVMAFGMFQALRLADHVEDIIKARAELEKM